MNNLSEILHTNRNEDETSWISISDMMTGLMMIFLFISIIYIQEVRTTMGTLSDLQETICSDLETEFKEDKAKWQMAICETGLLVRFNNEGFFEADSEQLTADFTELLSDFYPRFKSILWEHITDVDELRIEGHASSEATGGSRLDGYLYNTTLSQGRSFNVMDYVLRLPEINNNDEYLAWSYENLTAHGMSSSELLLNEDGMEDRQASRRVEFRVRTKAEDDLLELVKALDGT